MSPNRLLALVVGGIIAIFVLSMGGKIFEHIDADEILVVQDPIDGELHWYQTAGTKWQGFGTVTVYKKRSFYPFEGRIRFNEGGHGYPFGSIQWEMPMTVEHLNAIHTRFGSQKAVEEQLIKVVTDKSIYMSGPLLSSTESYSEKRADLIFWIEDQINHGVYKTKRTDVKTRDPITGEVKTVYLADIELNEEGQALRQEVSQLLQFGVRPYNFAITELKYEDKVEAQIQLQQDNIMAVQTAIAQSRKAEQEALTVEQQGRANAATQKWQQEALKAKAVTLAQQQLEVAQLDARAAEQERIANIRRGEGEAARKRLVMQADGALTQKLDTWLKVQTVYAEAIKGYQGQWVPTVVMGSNGSTLAASGATELIQLLTASTAKQLGLDLTIPSGRNIPVRGGGQ